MISTDPIERVLDVLTAASYESRPVPLRVGTVDFDFTAVLTSPDSLNLVVVINTLEWQDETAQRRLPVRIESLGGALDLASSRRPITVILVGAQLTRRTHERLARTARVLDVQPLGGTDIEIELRDALAVLLPLELPAVQDTTTESWEQLQRQANPDREQWLSDILAATIRGPENVRAALETSLGAPLDQGPAQ